MYIYIVSVQVPVCISYMYMYVGVTGKTYIAHNALTRKSALIWAAAASILAAFGSDAARTTHNQVVRKHKLLNSHDGTCTVGLSKCTENCL